MSGRNPKPKSPTTLSAEDLAAQSVMKAKEFIQTIDVAEEYGKVGAWIIPDTAKKFRDWHFVRMNRSMSMHRELAHVLHQKGYFFCHDVCPDVRMVGFESDGGTGNLNGDGGQGLYMCCPPQTWMFLQEQKRKAQALAASRLKDSFGGTVADLRGKLGGDAVSVTSKEIPIQ
tara:strand:+ start:349 stop:864 length:516 start_codon:yes stop_codon:yes gene_type:complete